MNSSRFLEIISNRIKYRINFYLIVQIYSIILKNLLKYQQDSNLLYVKFFDILRCIA